MMETNLERKTEGFKKTTISVKDALKTIPVQHTNPAADLYKPMLVDVINTKICNVLIGSADDINCAAGVEIAHHNFWHRPHRRIEFKERDVTTQFINSNLATGKFRELLCDKLSIIVPCVVAVPAALAALISLFY